MQQQNHATSSQAHRLALFSDLARFLHNALRIACVKRVLRACRRRLALLASRRARLPPAFAARQRARLRRIVLDCMRGG